MVGRVVMLYAKPKILDAVMMEIMTREMMWLFCAMNKKGAVWKLKVNRGVVVGMKMTKAKGEQESSELLLLTAYDMDEFCSCHWQP